MDADEFAARVEAVRRFNRFYTNQIGVLQERLLRSPFSITEARVLYELAHRKKPTATSLIRELALDPGYLSRILRRFQNRGLVRSAVSASDGRQSLLELTPQGARSFATLNSRSHREVGKILRTLPTGEQQRMIGAMHTLESILGAPPANAARDNVPYLIRLHQPGDMGWVVHRHGVLYAQEYGYDMQFEALVAAIVSGFIRNFDSKRERCWIAEKDGEIAGSVFLVKHSKRVAQLRLLLVEPKARGLGIGSRLVSECIRFARQAGYAKITLWTQSDLDAARHIYKQSGFRITKKKAHHSFGQDLVAETWEIKL